MVHEHHSRSHHFDLRLEFDGVLRSWAVPKGLSDEPGVRRLAMEVPDHALGYAPFEGTIPEGSYGAGEVEVWDRGTFEVKERDAGKLVLDIRGRRIRGVYHLVRTSMGGDPRKWLIFLEAAKEGATSKASAPRTTRAPKRSSKPRGPTDRPTRRPAQRSSPAVRSGARAR